MFFKLTVLSYPAVKIRIKYHIWIQRKTTANLDIFRLMFFPTSMYSTTTVSLLPSFKDVTKGGETDKKIDDRKSTCNLIILNTLTPCKILYFALFQQ